MLATLGRGHVSRKGADRILGVNASRRHIRALRRRYQLAIPCLGAIEKVGREPAWLWRYMCTATGRRKIARILAATATEQIA